MVTTVKLWKRHRFLSLEGESDMQNHDVSQSAGNLRISREVIATIARYAALEIDGVVSLASFATNL